MSSDIVIRVENLWKQYRYGVISHATLRKDFQSWWARVRGREDPNLPISYAQSAARKATDASASALRATQTIVEADDRFWALQDINFEVKQGEVLGIIGRNGAGKSTLLKIMSKVTTPTKGQIKIKGRIASLLEVGTGFHPELTGGENIYLNGAILGMTKNEIRRKFDEIVAFAEVEKFVDTPVKRYSSGMYVRLAFAVAAHLEPEILLVDEVLAVGDSLFQKKCIGKMGEVAKGGRTIFFVSHNLGAVRALCNKTLLLDKGSLMLIDDTEKIIKEYFVKSMFHKGLWKKRIDPEKDGGMHIEEISITNKRDQVVGHIDSDETFVINLTVHAAEDIEGSQIAVRITNHEGITVFTTANSDFPKNYPMINRGRHRYRIEIPADWLPPSQYSLTAACMIPRIKLFDAVENEIVFSVEDRKNHASFTSDNRLGVVTPLFRWHEVDA